MAVIPQQFRCDCGCGAVRGEENHWWLVSASTNTWQVEPWDDWRASEGAGSVGYKHAAGSECVHKLLNAWMEKQREGGK